LKVKKLFDLKFIIQFNKLCLNILESCATDEALIPEFSSLEYQNNVWDDSNRQELMSHEKNQGTVLKIN